MQPNSLQQTQQALAQAVRLGNAEALNGFAPHRLAVYVRLVRNNTFGFIDRCYIEAQRHVSTKAWQESKEHFLQQGKAHSPYFQDIAAEFLAFCQQAQLFNRHILALMDFENTQLQAEVATAKVPSTFNWNAQTTMQFSGAAFIKSYDVDFLSSQFQQFSPNTVNILVWRDSEFGINENLLSELDYWLLTYLQEQPSSLTQISTALSELLASNAQLHQTLQQVWGKWINNDVIYPIKHW